MEGGGKGWRVLKIGGEWWKEIKGGGNGREWKEGIGERWWRMVEVEHEGGRG